MVFFGLKVNSILELYMATIIEHYINFNMSEQSYNIIVII